MGPNRQIRLTASVVLSAWEIFEPAQETADPAPNRQSTSLRISLHSTTIERSVEVVQFLTKRCMPVCVSAQDLRSGIDMITDLGCMLTD